jgi:hypothetical protein
MPLRYTPGSSRKFESLPVWGGMQMMSANVIIGKGALEAVRCYPETGLESAELGYALKALEGRADV